ncbi:MAG: acyl carrier protein, partial [Chloroflexota bacterium]
TRFWAESLRLPPDLVTPDTDLFANGADSMEMVFLESRIEAMLNVALPDSALIEAPTPAEMAEVVQECRLKPVPFSGPLRDAQTTWFPGGDPGVPPLFAALVNGPSETAWLSRHIAGPRAIAAIKNRHPLPTDPALLDAWFDDHCEASVRRILEIDPVGPWRLMSVCGIAPFFWEVARRLSRSGDPSLLLIDPWFRDPGTPPPARHTESVHFFLGSRAAQPADFDLTLLLTPSWVHRPLAERYAALVPGPVELRFLPSSTPFHAITVDSLPYIAAEVQLWLASRDRGLFRHQPLPGSPT